MEQLDLILIYIIEERFVYLYWEHGEEELQLKDGIRKFLQ